MNFRQSLTVISVICTTAIVTVAFSAHADDLSYRLAGHMLLQVEQHGEAWWVNPKTHKRVYLSKPSAALEIMREHGLGISNADLRKIPVGLLDLDSQDQDGDGLHNTLEDSLGTNPSVADSDGDGLSDRDEIIAGLNPLGSGRLPITPLFAAAQAGQILLQVESRGEAWWVNPANSQRYYLGRPAEAFQIMRSFGIGISDRDLAQIEVTESSSLASPENTEAVVTADEPTPDAPPETITEATPSTNEPSSMPRLTSATAKDCGHDFDCLTNAITDGEPAQVTHETATDDGNVAVTLTLSHLATTTKNGQPILITKTENVTSSELSDVALHALRGAGKSQTEIDRISEAVLNSVTLAAGTQDWCVFNNSGSLRATVTHWGNDELTAADLDYASCCSVKADGAVDLNHCDSDFPLAGGCLLTAHPSTSLTVGDEPDEWVTRYAGSAQQVSWSSSDDTVVSLRETTGDKVTIDALKAGHATITVSDLAAGPGCAISYDISVND